MPDSSGRLEIKLDCSRCEPSRRDWERESENVVRCEDCGKRHSTDSLIAV